MPRTLAQNAQYIAETIKPAIKSAIEAQGVTVPSTDSFLDYADRIAEIEGGGSGYQLKDLPTGSIATVTDAAELPLNALKVSVEAWQEGSGDPSPSNIRPIHGWDSGEITVVGKNYAYNNMAADVDFNGVKWEKQADGSIKVSGTATANSYVINAVRADIGDYNGNIIVSGLNGVNNITIDTIPLYDKDNNLITSLAGGTADKVIDLSQYDGVRYLSITYKRITNSAVSGVIKPQIELGTTATTYEPYQGKQYTQQFPQTIYGAEWDVVNGGMKQTDGYIVFDGSSDEGWGLETGGKRVYSGMLRGIAQGSAQGIADITSNQFEATTSARTLAGNEGISIDGSGWLCVADGTGAMSAADWNTYLSEHPLQVRYKLITPTTTTLSPLSIRLLEGTNNIYADCGEVIEGEYFVGSSGAYDLYDYIQTDGTQCIDLGVKVNSGDVINCMYTPLTGMTNWNWLWIAEDTNTSKFSGVVFMSSTQMADYDYSVEANRRNWAADQINTSNFTASNGIDANIKFSDGAIVKLYSFSINGDDYLPCKRRSDGKFGLYDVKNSTFLTDSASGNAFVGGNNLGVRIG